MARAKSPSSKSTRTTKEQTSVSNAANLPDSNAVAAQAEPKSETRIIAEPRKFEVLKTESRNNVVPINLEDEIRRRAYELYQQRGPGGSEAGDWLAAEREIMQRYHQQSA